MSNSARFYRNGTVLLTACLAACSSGGGGGGGGGDDLPPIGSEQGPAAPSGITLESSNGQVRIDWNPVADADSYVLYWSEQAGFDPSSVPAGQFEAVTSPPVVVDTDGFGTLYCVVASVNADGLGLPSSERSELIALPSPYRYFPPWGAVPAANVILFEHDSGRTDMQNGDDLKAVIAALQPGDRLEIGAGTYTMEYALRIDLVGRDDAPIWITAQAGERPVIQRLDGNHNTFEVGTSGGAEYLVIRGLEIVGGDIAARFHDCNNVWFDDNDVHDTVNNAIAANSHDTDHLYFTRNEVHHTNGYGEGFYLGANNSEHVMHDSIVALNHVYETRGHQGDGIELKQGSWGNLIAENHVHDNNYPSILVYGTDGNPPNIIEKNLCYRSGDNVMQIQGEAIVRNNVALEGGTAFHSGDHQGVVRDLVVVHNTFLNDGTAVNLNQWGGKPGMVFSNNACYSQGTALRFGNGDNGVQVSGNVVYGSVLGTQSGYTLGGGLSDFEDASFDGSQRDVTPTLLGALPGSADQGMAAMEDATGVLRLPPYETGAVDLR